jgi:hypothetical protein
MSDASFRLLDRAGNETTFSPGGSFTSMAVAPGRNMVRSVSQDGRTVNFSYTVDPNGEVRIARANLADEAGTGPVLAVRYDYDAEGRLARVAGPGSQLGQIEENAGNASELAAN